MLLQSGAPPPRWETRSSPDVANTPAAAARDKGRSCLCRYCSRWECRCRLRWEAELRLWETGAPPQLTLRGMDDGVTAAGTTREEAPRLYGKQSRGCARRRRRPSCLPLPYINPGNIATSAILLFGNDLNAKLDWNDKFRVLISGLEFGVYSGHCLRVQGFLDFTRL
jgi:hypothetical protein